jgi:3-hydroxy-9,10-secoandrosta-1,3,5(10)-triene-9,17-dione monooxygenase reductase component
LDSIQEGLKHAMRSYPQGVTVVTTQAPDGPEGITVSSFISVSLSPPLVLVSIAKDARFQEHFTGAKAFAINFLAHDQRSISERFAGFTGALDRFDGVRHAPGVTGSPMIEGACAALECKAWRVYDGGDHSLIVGEVVRAAVLSKKKPLVYHDRGYSSTGAA